MVRIHGSDGRRHFTREQKSKVFDGAGNEGVPARQNRNESACREAPFYLSQVLSIFPVASRKRKEDESRVRADIKACQQPRIFLMHHKDSLSFREGQRRKLHGDVIRQIITSVPVS